MARNQQPARQNRSNGGFFDAAGTVGFVIGYVLWKWFTGGTWRHNYQGRRYLSRPVRATLQTLPVVFAVAFVIAPAATGWVTVSVVIGLFGTAGAYRLRAWLDAREAAKPVIRAKVKVGEPIRPTPPPIDVEVLELPRDPAAATRYLIRRLEAAR